jgi:hypothetical protein
MEARSIINARELGGDAYSIDIEHRVAFFDPSISPPRKKSANTDVGLKAL